MNGCAEPTPSHNDDPHFQRQTEVQSFERFLQNAETDLKSVNCSKLVPLRPLDKHIHRDVA